MEHFKSASDANIAAYNFKNRHPPTPYPSSLLSKKSVTAEPPVTESGAAAGTRLKGPLCSSRNKDESRLLMKPLQTDWSSCTNIMAVTRRTLHVKKKNKKTRHTLLLIRDIRVKLKMNFT